MWRMLILLIKCASIVYKNGRLTPAAGIIKAVFTKLSIGYFWYKKRVHLLLSGYLYYKIMGNRVYEFVIFTNLVE